MSAAVTIIADEVTGALFRLAGARVVIPQPTAAAAVNEALTAARADSALVVMTAELARSLPGEVLEEALRSGEPLTLIIEDVRGGVPAADLVAKTRRILGVEG
jgi:vacuolar-type H+-ATPase subunit F/Vma7